MKHDDIRIFNFSDLPNESLDRLVTAVERLFHLGEIKKLAIRSYTKTALVTVTYEISHERRRDIHLEMEDVWATVKGTFPDKLCVSRQWFCVGLTK